ncbi:hypothetical protein ABIB82_002983 [Bradyrhizobium sp. i1.8.4]|uniref:hypothetical protein n=1 Tax=unclassified Bradyrhizobium TaxID=2631580 RepID=UPI003D22391C
MTYTAGVGSTPSPSRGYPRILKYSTAADTVPVLFATTNPGCGRMAKERQPISISAPSGLRHISKSKTNQCLAAPPLLPRVLHLGDGVSG